MAVKIRLKRTGKKKQPSYRVVVADSRSPRDGRYIEQIGRYHPLLEPSEIVIDNDRAAYWLSVGAQPSDAVRKLLEISGALDARAKPAVQHDPKVHVVGEEAQIVAAADDAELAEVAAAEVIEEAASEVEEIVEAVTETAEEAVTETAEAVTETAEAVTETAEAVTETAEAAVEEAADAVVEEIAEATDTPEAEAGAGEEDGKDQA